MARAKGSLLGLLAGGVLLDTPRTADAWEIGGCFASFCGLGP